MQDSVAERFRKRLRELRESREWTQERAAEACGIDYKLYQFYELGIQANPGLVTLEKIARGFGLDVSEFLAPTLPKATRRQVRSVKSRSVAKVKQR